MSLGIGKDVIGSKVPRAGQLKGRMSRGSHGVLRSTGWRHGQIRPICGVNASCKTLNRPRRITSSPLLSKEETAHSSTEMWRCKNCPRCGDVKMSEMMALLISVAAQVNSPKFGKFPCSRTGGSTRQQTCQHLAKPLVLRLPILPCCICAERQASTPVRSIKGKKKGLSRVASPHQYHHLPSPPTLMAYPWAYWQSMAPASLNPQCVRYEGQRS